MSEMFALILKETRDQLHWLGAWLLATHAKVLMLLLGFTISKLAGIPLPELPEGPDTIFLIGVFSVLRNDSSLTMLFLAGFFFFWGGFRFFHKEAQQRSIAWLRTMPVSERRVAGAKLVAGALFVLLALLPDFLFFVWFVDPNATPLMGQLGYTWMFVKQWGFVSVVMFSFFVGGSLAGAYARGTVRGWGDLASAAVSARTGAWKNLLVIAGVWIAGLVAIVFTMVALSVAGARDAWLWLGHYGASGLGVRALAVTGAHAIVSVILAWQVLRAYATRPLWN